MTLFSKALLIVLVGLVFVAPFTVTAHCEGDHESECATECACVCCYASAVARLESVCELTSQKPEHAGFTEMRFMGRLSPAEIFRPPISA